jgi:hypothetical protein
LIEVDQAIGADQAFAVGVGADLDAGAASARADLESRAMIRERIGPVFIDKRDGDQELLDGGALGAPLRVVRILNSLQIELIPMMVGRVACVSFILVLNGVAEGIGRLREASAEHLGSILRIGSGGWVVRQGERRAVHTD